MKALKKIASLLLAGAMLFSLAACGGQGTVTNNPDESSDSGETSEESTGETAETSTRPPSHRAQCHLG